MDLYELIISVMTISTTIAVSTAQGSGTWLIYANLKTIERLDIKTNVTQTIATELVRAVHLDVHYERGFVYWTDMQTDKISRCKFSTNSMSNEVEDIITDKIITPDGMAIDWMYDLLYWTDAGLDHIQVSHLDGTDRKTIIKGNTLQKPRAITVDPSSGWLFFSDWGSHPRIERCSMDGRERVVIVNTSIVWPNGMSIDHVAKRLYWIDGKLNKIESSGLDGTDRITLIKDREKLPLPFDLVFFNSNVYWSNGHYQSLYVLNKFSFNDSKAIALNLISPRGITAYGEGFQPNGQNVCRQSNGGCSHICYPTPTLDMTASTTSACMCPDEYTLSRNNKTCITSEKDVATSRSDSTRGTTRSSTDGNRNFIITGISLGSVIFIVVAIVFGIYRRHLQMQQANQKREGNQPNSVYCIIGEDNELQCTSSTANMYETLIARNVKNADEMNVYEQIPTPHSKKS